MIGAVLFIIFFLLFLAVTLEMPTLPPGDMIHDLLAIPRVDYPVLGIPAWLLVTAIVNGVVYGFVIWMIYSLARYATESRKKEERQPYAPPPSAGPQQRSMPPEVPPARYAPPPSTPPPHHTPPPQMTPPQQPRPQVPTQAPPPQAPSPEPTPAPAVQPPQYTPPPPHTPPPSAPAPQETTPKPVAPSRYTAPTPTPAPVPIPTPPPTEAPTQPAPAPAAPAQPAPKEEIIVSSENLVDKVKELLHEGNVTRIIIKDEKGKILLDMPASIGVAGTVAAPWLAGLGAIAALATKCTISVVRRE